MLKQVFLYCRFFLGNWFTVHLLLSYLFFQCTWNGFAELDIDGSFRVRGVLAQIHSGKETSLLTQGRLHIKGAFRPSNKLKTQVHFLSSNLYGETLSFEESFRVYPFGSWLINEDLELRLGRITYSNKFHQIVSINDYEPFFYTFDGVFLEYNTNIINVNVWGAYLPKMESVTEWDQRHNRSQKDYGLESREGETQIQQLEYGFGLFLDIESISDYINHFNLHVAYLGDSFLPSESKKISRYGIGLEGAINAIDLAYTFVLIGQSKGFRFKLEDNMRHFQLSYSRPDFFDSKIFAGYHTDSSQYKPWLYDRHKNAGLLDLFLWGNLTYYFFGFSASVDPLFDIEISFYGLSLTEKGHIRLGRFGSLLEVESESVINTGYKTLGKELDVKLQRKIKEDFEIHLLAGLFIPHLKLKRSSKKNALYNNIQLTGLYKF